MRWEEAEVTRIGDLESQLIEMGEMVCARHTMPAGFDSAPLYRGLPADMCPCEHWCYLVEGRLRYRFADGGEELVAETGQAFHVRGGHLAEVLEDSELIEFTVAEDYHRKARHLSEEPVRLVPYDDRWPRLFEQERAALEGAIGDFVTGGIHHVGSTAVPGLSAKPIIDILVGVGSLDESKRCFEPLARLDYVYAPYLSDQMHWFCKPHPSRRTHHLHLVPTASDRYRDELAFRDLLRARPSLAADYAGLKDELAARHRNDREAYTDAKGAFIRAALLE